MKKLIAILLVAAMMFSLCACGSESGSSKRKNKNSEDSAYGEQSYTEPEAEKFFEPAKVQKIGTSERKAHVYYDSDAGLYGVISVDGKYDTGLKYVHYSTTYTDEYYEARTKKYGAADDFDSINSVELLDPYGNTLIGGYCHYEVISERFFVAAKVVAINEDGASDFTYETADGRVSYDAEFYAYDIKRDKIVDGVKSHKFFMSASGAFIKFYVDEENFATINADGYEIPEGADFIGDDLTTRSDKNIVGYYKIIKDGVGTVYNDKNEVVYTFDRDEKDGYGYEPSDFSNGYSLGSRGYYTENQYHAIEVLLDESFTPVSPEIDVGNTHKYQIGLQNTIMLFKNLEEPAPYRLYNTNGEIIYETENSLSCEVANSHRGDVPYFLFIDGGQDVIISKDGEIMYKGSGEAVAEFNHTAYAACRTVGEDCYYFCMKDKDFTVKAKAFASLGPNLVKIDAEDGTKYVVDLATGETVISGYKDYNARTLGGDTYIFANYNNETSDIFYVAG